MKREDIIEIIKSTASSCKAIDGWIHLGTFGLELKKNGFDYKTSGLSKMSYFISGYTDILDIKEDSSYQPPVTFIKIKDGTSKQIRTKSKPLEESPKSAIFSWAWLGKDFDTTIKKLKDKSLKGESWNYGKYSKSKAYPILVNYLIYTFYKLTQEKNKIKETEKYAAFNTGLVDERYEPIYALFSKSTRSNRKWEFADFCVAGEDWSGKTLVSNFNPLPERANYFKTASDLFYDSTALAPSLDYEHILVENIGRLPSEFIKENCPNGFAIQDTSRMDFETKKKYYSDLGVAIKKDSRTYRYMKGRLSDALELAIKRVEWNYKTAIPTYFPKTNKMCLLLPLSLVEDEKVDVALVVEKTASGNYLGHTVLPLDWAYSNSRLICRPDSDWLVAEKIVTIEEEE